MLDNNSVMAKTVNGFKTKLERERAKKMGLFLDRCPLGLGAVTEFRSGRPASILLQVLFHSFHEYGNFWHQVFSQGSVATYARCGGIFNNYSIANFLENLPVKKTF